MKLKYEMSVINIDNEKMAVPLESADEFWGVLQMNDTAESILKLLEQNTDEDTIVSALAEEYEASKEQLQYSVRKIIAILRQEGLLTE